MKNQGTYGGFRASGKLGNVIVAQDNKGRQCIRSYFKPHNPKSNKQQDRRQLFRQASQEYKALTPAQKEPWKLEAKKKITTPTALYFKWYLKNNGSLAFLGLARLGWARLAREEV